MKIRRAVVEDILQVARVFKSSREFALPYLPRLHTADEDFEFFLRVVFPNQQIFVCETDGGILGFIAYDNDWVHHLYVLPDSIGEGIGERLLAQAFSGSKQLQLWAFQRNERAIAFYEKHGFRIVQKTNGEGNEENEPDVRMQWNAV